MTNYDFDMIVIGAGSGGMAVSRRAASYGARVAVCELGDIGGTCVLRGCVPKKLLMYGGQFRDHFEDAPGYGWEVAASFTWETLLANKDREVARLSQKHRTSFNDAGIQILAGTATFVDAHTIEVAGRSYSACHIVIATGSYPAYPRDVPGLDRALTSDDLLSLPHLPKSMLVIGGGYIAVEFASIMHGFGVEITQVLRGDHILRGFDRGVALCLEQHMLSRGIKLNPRVQLDRLEVSSEGSGGYRLVARDGRHFEAEQVLIALGRTPNTQGLGLTKLGIDQKADGSISVDDQLRTSIPNVYAIGDVVARYALTPVAIAEGRAIAETLYNDNPTQVNYDNIPTAVFATPHLTTVGLSEEQAQTNGYDYLLYETTFPPMKHSLARRDEQVLIKLVVDRPTERVLGCHMLGNDSPEIIQSLAVALNCQATKSDFDRTMSLHPTVAEEFVTLRSRRPLEVR